MDPTGGDQSAQKGKRRASFKAMLINPPGMENCLDANDVDETLKSAVLFMAQGNEIKVSEYSFTTEILVRWEESMFQQSFVDEESLESQRVNTKYRYFCSKEAYQCFCDIKRAVKNVQDGNQLPESYQYVDRPMKNKIMEKMNTEDSSRKSWPDELRSSP